MLTWFLGVSLVLALFFIRPEERVDLRFFKDHLFFITTFLSIMLFGIKFSKRLWPIVVLCIYSFIIIQASNNYWIYFQWTMFLAGMILMYQLCEKEINTSLITNFFCIVSIISSIWVILELNGFDLQLWFYNLIGLDNISRVGLVGGKLIKLPVSVNGPLGQSTITGALIGSTLVCFYRKKWFILIPLIAYGIYATASAMTLISAVFSTIIWVVVSYRRSIWFFIAGIPALPFIYYTFPQFFSDNGRFETWKKIFALYDWGVFGKGAGWFYAVSSVKNPAGQVFKHVHSEPIELYIAFGLPGILIAIVLLSRIRIIDKIIFSVFIGLMVNSLANLTFHISILSYIGIICYCILQKKES